MSEVAFRLKNGCGLYERYFIEKAEKGKFHQLAREFFKNHGFALNEARYYIASHFATDLTPEEAEQYKGQLKKQKDENGLYVFKKNSVIHKAWQNEVVSQVNMDNIYCTQGWALRYITFSGSHTLWDYNGEVYGRIRSDSATAETLSDEFIVIKMSEYHEIRERRLAEIE